jgi:UDPglucose 6-dehydrogenase
MNDKTNKHSQIGVVGLWHLGCVTAACLSSLGHKVIGFDDKRITENLKNNALPIDEPGLPELIKNNPLQFSNDFSLIAQMDFIFITFDTPIDEKDDVDITIITDAFKKITRYLNEKAIIVISSQVPVGTSQQLIKQLRNEGKKNEMCYLPENLKLGAAINAFMHPKRIVLGLSSTAIQKPMIGLFDGIQTEFCIMDLNSAEMTKHALNSYLATLISWSSEISDLCEATGANAIDVMNALKLEERVSSKAPIIPGLGFGGGTLGRDVQILRHIGKTKNIRTPLLDSVITINNTRMCYVRDRLSHLLGPLSGKTITFLGLTYKANTSTLRRSLTLQLINEFTKAVTIKAYDPAINHKIENYPHVTICDSVESAAKDSDALVVMTDWDEFKKVDYGKLSTLMSTPLLLDTKNMFNAVDMKGMQYHAIGI